MYDTILIPTDGSKPAAQAAEQGFELAQRFEATIHILYVIEMGDTFPLNPSGGASPATLDDEITSEIEKEATAIVDELAAQATEAGLDVITEVRQGVARNDILNYANENTIELIVMGTHGRSGVERFLLGSVTERVIRTADVPVFVTRTDQ